MSDKTQDRELLEFAAKAAGYTNFEWGFEVAFPRIYDPRGFMLGWNPLTDDGDALRLAVKLELKVLRGQCQALDYDVWKIEQDGNDMYAATRRAIVRAAAEIGKAKS